MGCPMPRRLKVFGSFSGKQLCVLEESLDPLPVREGLAVPQVTGFPRKETDTSQAGHTPGFLAVCLPVTQVPHIPAGAHGQMQWLLQTTAFIFSVSHW